MTYRPKKTTFFARRTSNDKPSILRRIPFAGVLQTGGFSKRSRLMKNGLKAVGILALIGSVTGVLGLAILFAWVSRDLPDPNRLLERQAQASTKIWDRTGAHLLYEIHGDQKRTVVQLQGVSRYAINAAIASEDRNFYQHHGVELQSFLRAIFDRIFRGRRLQGTSTITQQVVKNVILSSERSPIRKAKEVVLAFEIERKFTKDQILQIYFNEVPYGSTAYGIESASQMYYGKSAESLDPAEGALLAAIVPAPTRLSPYGSYKDELLWRWKHILDTEHDMGNLTEEEWADAKSEDILSHVKPKLENISAPHFVLYVKELLAERYGERVVEEGGLNVVTTLDYDKQQAAEQAVKDGMDIVRKNGGSNAALVAEDPKTGQILAMVGSADYFDVAHDGNVNVALRPRQPGSSFKPIVYAAAFEKGYTPSTVVFDVNTSFPTDTGTPYQPHDYDLGERGPLTLKKALGGSLNIPAVKTLYLTGIDRALDFAESLGYTTLRDRSRFGLSLVLGGAEVKLVEHVAAYGSFATEGTYRAPAYILSVKDASGATLEEWKDAPKENLMSTETARNINNILSDNDNRAYIFGTKNYLTLPDRPVAAKTGTTNNFVDAWTMGYTPGLAAGVWTGNNDNTPMKKGSDGSRVAAPIWQSFMKAALKDAPVESFIPPQPIATGKPVLDGQAGEIHVRVDKFSGKLATEATPPTAVEDRVYRQAHDVLYYVNKDDPHGPYPADPGSDPQFAAWEAGVADWATRNNWVTTEPPPTESDDLHASGDAPTVSFITPSDGSAIASRTFTARVSPSGPRGIRRVEFTIDGALVGTTTGYPWEAQLTLPPAYGRGFSTLRATAYDEIESFGSQDLSINITSDGVPVTLAWLRPSSAITYRQRAFPIYIDTAMNLHLGVSRVTIRAIPESAGSASGTETIEVGSLANPKTDGVSVSWDTSPDPGTYRLEALITFSNNETQLEEGPRITVKQ